MQPTGDVFIVSQKKARSKKSLNPRPTLSSDTMRLLRRSFKITFEHPTEEELLSEYTGAIQELERHTDRLKKQVQMLTLRDQLLSGGTVTDKKRMLSLMNSQDSSASSTCSDGLIGSPLMSKSKEVLVPCTQLTSGSLQMSHLMSGTQTPTQQPSKGKRSRED